MLFFCYFVLILLILVNDKFHRIKWAIYIKPKLFFYLIFIFVLSSCTAVRKGTKNNSTDKKYNGEENQQEKKNVKTICYCPSF